MSVSVHWTPVSTENWLNNAGSSEVTALTKVFGEMPIRLQNDDPTMDKLTAMAATYSLSGKNPYEVLRDALLQHGEIIISASY